METVLRWVLRQDLEPARAALTAEGVDTAADVLAGLAATDPREQSGIWSTHRRPAGRLPLRRRARQRRGPQLRPPTPGRHPRHRVHLRAGPLPGAGGARSWSPSSSRCGPGTYAAVGGRPAPAPPRVPLTLVLDELANIAPIPDLPAMVSEGGGQGLLTLACLQDLSQARQRWGRAADGFLSLFGTKLVLPGIGDLATLELVSRLGGEIDVPARSVSHNPLGLGRRHA